MQITAAELAEKIRKHFNYGFTYGVYGPELEVLSATVSTGLRVVEISAKALINANVPPMYSNCAIFIRDLHKLGVDDMKIAALHLKDSLIVYAAVVVLPEGFELPDILLDTRYPFRKARLFHLTQMETV